MLLPSEDDLRIPPPMGGAQFSLKVKSFDTIELRASMEMETAELWHTLRNSIMTCQLWVLRLALTCSPLQPVGKI